MHLLSNSNVSSVPDRCIFEKGEKFGSWTTTGYSEKRRIGESRLWQVECECGKTRFCRPNVLKRFRKEGRPCNHGCPIVDIAGMKFGILTVLQVDPEPRASKKHVFKWICECECGTVKSIHGHFLRTGHTISCGCIQKERQRRAVTLDRKAASINQSLSTYTNSARSRNLEWKLSFEEFSRMVFSSCHYCGATPSGEAWKNHRLLLNTNGIDRMDRTMGYISSNCVPCCKRCNISKGVMSVDEFIAMAHLVVDKHPRSR